MLSTKSLYCWSLNNFISPNFCNRNKKNYVPLFLLKSILLFHNWCSCQFSSPLLLSHGHSTRQLDPSKLLIRIDQSAVRRQWSSFWIEKKTHSHNQTIFLVVCHCNDKVNKWNELRQNPKSKSRTKNLSLCIVYTNWFRDYHLDNFSCPWGLFTQFSHINILLIGSFYLLRSSLGNERWYHITYKLNHGHLFWKLSPSTICLSGLLWRQAAKGRPKQLWETNHGGRKFSKLWPEGSIYVMCVLNNTFGQFIRFHLFSNSDNIVLWHPH